LQSEDFVHVFQSDLSYDSVLAIKCSYAFVHMCGLNDVFWHVAWSLSTLCSWWISSPVCIFGTQVQKNASWNSNYFSLWG